MGLLANNLLGSSFLTGSRAFGTNKSSSDFDLVVPIVAWDHVRTILDGLREAVKTESDYFQGLKYRWYLPNGRFVLDRDSLELNIIPVHGDSFRSWYLATLAMAATAATADFRYPQQKYATFEAMVAAFKSATYKPGKDWVDEYPTICKEARLNPLLSRGYNQLYNWLNLLQDTLRIPNEIGF